MALKAVLFDFDDTLYDHKHSSQTGLRALYTASDILQSQPFAVLETEYAKCLEHFHTLTIRGENSLDEIRLLRTQAIFKFYGVILNDEQAHAFDKIYRNAYYEAEQEVAGALNLIQALKAQGYKIGIVTNHIAVEQWRKINDLGMRDYIDAMLAAHDYGISKPDPQVFQMVLDELAVEAHETVMVGDAWHSDIEGAYAMGIRAIWLNRYNHAYPDATKAVQITALEPHNTVLALITGK